jgi:hypothetical protein
MLNKVKAARRVGVPLINIYTSDEFAVLDILVGGINNNSPIFRFDIASGLTATNDLASNVISDIMGDLDPSLFSDPVTAITAMIQGSPEKSVLIVMGSQRILSEVKVQQAICNSRNLFKTTLRTIILLSSESLQLPSDISGDILLINDLVPDEEKRAEIISEIITASELPVLSETDLKTAVRATRGMSAYAVEQAVALSMSKSGLDLKQLWERWKQNINSVAGLSIDDSKATMSDIGGLDNIKDFATKLMNGNDSPSVIVRIEEIEKAMSGSGAGGSIGDSSGTTQGMLGSMLTFMQEENATGLIAVGAPGSGKSLCSTAIGSAGGIPTITLDLGALKGSLVGQTESNTRKALATIKAVAGKNVFFIATCNGLASLPPELKRRFQFGIWYFDLPTNEERETIWKIWLKKYPQVKDVRPDDSGYTGAEIRTCVQIAHRLNITPKEAASWVVPVSKMAAETIETLRTQANGRYLSANKSGTYQKNSVAITTNQTRKIDLE